MAKWLLVVEANCVDPAREAEFTQWYDNVHIPDVLKTPGFIKGTRYEFLAPWGVEGHDTTEEKAKFLITYEIEADDPIEVMNTLRSNFEKMGPRGRLSELLTLVSVNIFKRMSSLPE